VIQHAPVTSSFPAATQFQRDLIALIPYLRAFSRVLCSGKAVAEDMAQEALAKAWRSQASFEAGTNLKAWLFTILRNEIYSAGRRAWRQADWQQEKAERIAGPSLEQEWKLNLSDAARALATLPAGQREALILVGAGGFTYEEAASISGVALGTMKSRVARARHALVETMDGERPMPPRSPTRLASDILAQLSTLAAGTRQAAVHFA